MAEINNKLNLLWDDNPVDVTQEANFIWNIANKLRGTYMPDKYGDVIIPMTVLRRFECALAKTKDAVLKAVEELLKNPIDFEAARRAAVTYDQAAWEANTSLLSAIFLHKYIRSAR
jgi:type I restriction-modification system DNA methylase subunit